MELVDWIILAVLLGAVFGGMAQGLFRTVCSLLGLILGIALACWNYARLAAVFKPLVRADAVADAIGFLLIAVVVMFVANLIGIMLSKMFSSIGLGCIDVLGGAIVGFVQGVLLVTIGILVTVAFFPQTQWLTHATLPKEFFGALHLSTDVTPGELKGRVLDGLKSLKHDTPEWMHEKNGGT
jgi:membrane protein required for colicin V production